MQEIWIESDGFLVGFFANLDGLGVESSFPDTAMYLEIEGTTPAL